MSTLPAKQQFGVLTSRYANCLAGDMGTVLLLLLQAPFIGYLCTLVWGSIESDTPSLYFVLCLSSLWFGCIAACREIVRERAILERERFFGLSLVAYVASKFLILGVLSLGQVLLLQMAVEWKLALNGPFLIQTVALWLVSGCGIGLGLFVSALSRSQERAVGAIPLLILPQILFSEFTVPSSYFSDVVLWIERFMPVHWAYRIFEELAETQTGWLDVSLAFGLLTVMLLILCFGTTFALIPRRES